ncbi:MAG: high-affinity branched-chain amino acid ABC transporter ATP-binding protein LivG [Mesoaciditoga sp.]|uniref:ABC transporter ATP-binding protein n=1 Tax=Athalassotoga sp. TaxID=2022597 RepID=UPI000CC306E8|nr:MAG: high-affinity branched-chain amino acid ABC transporter ATP-binding protein LivG [Mesoaciditoga sp.]HEU24041.1 ABC transporter ATP-binding protein [Mesoaciditoga lauensis]
MSENVLKIDGMTVRFGGLTAVDSFSMYINKGELIGLIGPNGAGKTTVFNAITGIYKPQSGRIFFKGIDITGQSPQLINQIGIARTFQNIRLFSDMSVIENVMVGQHSYFTNGKALKFLHKHNSEYPKPSWKPWLVSAILKMPSYLKAEKAMKDKAFELLKRMGLQKYADYKALSLPYGQQRKVEIARALATNPSLLILDEPAAGMNPHESEELLETVKEIMKEFSLTILLIEHDMKFVMNLCERIYVLDYGRLISHGSPYEVQNDKKVIEAYLGDEVYA